MTQESRETLSLFHPSITRTPNTSSTYFADSSAMDVIQILLKLIQELYGSKCRISPKAFLLFQYIKKS